MPKLFYQGHGSFRLTANDGRMVYVDPFAGSGYDLPADQMKSLFGEKASVYRHEEWGISL